MIKRFFAILLTVIFISCNVYATDKYVDTDGSDTFANASNIGTPCSLQTYNTNADDDDVALMRAGTYDDTNEYINPTNSGSSGHYITYQNYNEEVVTITGVSNGAYLIGKQYIKIDGIRIIDTELRWINAKNTGSIDTYHIIQNCYFEGGESFQGIYFQRSNYNQILDNEFLSTCDLTEETACETDCESGPGNHIKISISYYNLIEGNTFSYAPHANVNVRDGSRYNVVKGNSFNNPWHTALGVIGNAPPGTVTGGMINLVEDNTFDDTGSEHTSNWCGPLVTRETNAWDGNVPQLNSQETIIRLNTMANNGAFNIESITSENGYAAGNRIYNNTMYGNIRTIATSTSNVAPDNIFKNNIIYASTDYSLWINNTAASGFTFDYNNISGGNFKFIGTNTNRLEVNPLFTDQDNGNFTLTVDSPMIDAGDWLTTITSTNGSGTSFVVDDSTWYIDGWGIVTGDEIKLEDDLTSVTITGINYGTNTITVDESVSWTQGDGVSLTYNGVSLDMGAIEYNSDAPPVCINTTPNPAACESPLEYACVTDEPATCKFCYDGVGGCDSDTDYDTMPETFDTTGSTFHLESDTVVVPDDCGAAYPTIFVRCKDAADNKAIVSVEISGDFNPPPIEGATGLGDGTNAVGCGPGCVLGDGGS